MSDGNSLSRLEAVNKRLLKLGIAEADLDEQFIRSGGKGGQNINKVATAVRLSCHKAGEEVKCMEKRSQLLNRVRAREILAERIEKKKETARLAAQAEAAKRKKQRAGRPKSVKKRILRDKRIRGELKKGRSYKGEE